jgi:hypothetical protein
MSGQTFSPEERRDILDLLGRYFSPSTPATQRASSLVSLKMGS